MAAPYQLATTDLFLTDGMGGSARLVAHLSNVGFLSSRADQHFLYITSEMSRTQRVALDRLLTDRAHHISELRWICYHLLETSAGLGRDEIARRFNKSTDSVRRGVHNVAHALTRPDHYKQLLARYRAVSTSFTTYLHGYQS